MISSAKKETLGIMLQIAPERGPVDVAAGGAGPRDLAPQEDDVSTAGNCGVSYDFPHNT